VLSKASASGTFGKVSHGFGWASTARASPGRFEEDGAKANIAMIRAASPLNVAAALRCLQRALMRTPSLAIHFLSSSPLASDQITPFLFSTSPSSLRSGIAL
jgi:hypothetical protein